MTAIRRALISVSDKTGIEDFARRLAAQGIEILSTGGTARLLREAGLEITEVSEHTGFPEIMAGRVKTLHPKIHGGLLGRRGTDEAVMAEHGIDPIDLLVINLYPFEQTVARPDCRMGDAIENIDIGGPAMLRAAAKNHAAVTVLVDPTDYADVLEEIGAGGVSDATRYRLAVKTFAHTARYDGMISNWLGQRDETGSESDWPSAFSMQFDLRDALRYGENPHQAAAFYTERDAAPGTISSAEQLQGKPLSFNNIADADAALECVKQFDAPACVIVKHANPCGVAVASGLLEAYERAYATDSTSAFGGIIAFNRPLDADTARAIVERQFVEVVLAPSIEDAAAQVFAAKKNVRLMATGEWSGETSGLDYRRVAGGLLIQDRDAGRIEADSLKVVTQRAPSDDETADMLFAWRVAKFVKSNAIVYAKAAQTIGVGAGQMSRVYSARIAAIKAADAGLEVKGSVMASDAFFPFRDSIDSAAEAGISAIIQPGGSIRDEEVIHAADEHGMAMVFTGMRHFRH